MHTNDRLLASYYGADMLSMHNNNAEEENNIQDEMNIYNGTSKSSNSSSNNNGVVDKSSDLRTLRRAIIKFNTNPKTGIELLLKNNLINHDSPTDIAYFLYTQGTLPNGQKINSERLSPLRIGEYLGHIGGKDEESRKFHRSMLDAYVRLFNFHGLSLVSALRMFLSAFRLPGEAQVIDRIMARFGEVFVRDNPDILRNADAAYVLSFAAIMLNTDLHRSSIRNKMSRQQFTKNMVGIDGGANVDPKLLLNIYDDIAQRPLASEIDCDVVTFFSPAKQGWLLKRCTGTVPRWKKRYFVLADGVLYYFLSPNDVSTGVPRCIVPLEHAGVEGTGMTGIRIFPLEDNGISNTTTPNAKVILLSPNSYNNARNNNNKAKYLVSAKRTDTGVMRKGAYEQFIVRAETQNDRQTWLSALSAHSSGGHMNRIRRLSIVKMATSAMVATVTANAALQSPISISNGKGGVVDTSVLLSTVGSNINSNNTNTTVTNNESTVSTDNSVNVVTQSEPLTHQHEPSFSQPSHENEDISFLIKGKDSNEELVVPVYLDMEKDKENNVPVNIPKLFSSPHHHHSSSSQGDETALRTPILSSQTPVSPRTPLSVPATDIFSLGNDTSIRTSSSLKGPHAFSTSVPASPSASISSNTSNNGTISSSNHTNSSTITGLPLLPPPPQRGVSNASSNTIKALLPPPPAPAPRTPVLPIVHTNDSNNNHRHLPNIAHEHLLQLAAAAAAAVSTDDNDDTSALLDTASELSSVDDDDTVGNGGSHSAWSEDAEFFDEDLNFGTHTDTVSRLPTTKGMNKELTDSDDENNGNDSSENDDNDKIPGSSGFQYNGKSNSAPYSRSSKIQGQLSKHTHPVKNHPTVYGSNTITSGIPPNTSTITTKAISSSPFRSSPIKERTKLAGDSHAFVSAFNRNKLNNLTLQSSPQRSSIQNRPVFGNGNSNEEDNNDDDGTLENHQYIQDNQEGQSTRLRNGFNTGLSNTLRLLGGHTTAAIGGFERTFSSDDTGINGSGPNNNNSVDSADINGVLASLPPLPPATQKHDIKKVLDIMTGNNSRHPPNQARTRNQVSNNLTGMDTNHPLSSDPHTSLSSTMINHHEPSLSHAFPSIDSDNGTRPREGSNSVLLQ